MSVPKQRQKRKASVRNNEDTNFRVHRSKQRYDVTAIPKGPEFFRRIHLPREMEDRYEMTYRECKIWKLFSIKRMKREMERECPDHITPMNKLSMIRTWMKYGDPLHNTEYLRLIEYWKRKDSSYFTSGDNSFWRKYFEGQKVGVDLL